MSWTSNWKKPPWSLERNEKELLAVEVEDGKLLYGKGEEAFGLRDVSMTVRSGTVMLKTRVGNVTSLFVRSYALLGPSGCGKTTLLSTLVGLKTLQSGRVKVFGHEVGVQGSGVPGPWIGYMPQDLCLYSELTSEETLWYFASLHRISGLQILERTEFLLDLLDLPSGRQTSRLSGGQQRRLSLATALVHDPPLLLLDEPTVGVDPLLRKIIWSHLCHLSGKLGKTILITTHYIEEAGRADVVGLMRDGKILEQDEPRILKERCRTSTLEEVFLKLCLKEKEGDSTSQRVIGEQKMETVEAGARGVINDAFEREDTGKGESCDDLGEIASTSRGVCGSERAVSATVGVNNLRKPLPKLNKSFRDFCAIVSATILKNMQIIRRNFVFLILAFASPLSNVLLAKLLLAHEPYDVTVALVNDETPAIVSQKLIDHLDKKTFDLRNYSSLEEAKKQLRTAKVQAVLHIGPNFTQDTLKRVQDGLSTDNVTVQGSTLRIYSYNINLEVDRTIYNAVLEAYAKMSEEAVETLGMEPGVSKSALTFEKPVLGHEKPDFSDYMVHNMLPDSLFMMSMALSALVFVGERSSGLFDRSRVSGVVPLQILLSHLVIQSVITLVQIVLLLLFLLSFRMEVKGSYILLVFLFYQASYFGMALGIFVSSVMRTPHAALLITVFIYWSSISISGLMWPTEAFPPVVREICQVHPSNWNYRAVSKVILNGIGSNSFHVWKSVLLSSGLTFLVLMVAILLLKRTL